MSTRADDFNTTIIRRDNRMLKAISTWVGIAVAVGSLGLAIAKSYFTTPLKLEDHDKQLQQLHDTDAAMSRDLREQRDILIEIKGDVKYLRRNNGGQQ